MNEGLLVFEGILAFGARDTEDAEHFFEHTLGLTPAEVEGEVRFYPLADDLALAIDTTGGFAEMPPYLLFSSPNLEAAREHFVRRGCNIIEMDTADTQAAGRGAGHPFRRCGRVRRHNLCCGQ